MRKSTLRATAAVQALAIFGAGAFAAAPAAAQSNQEQTKVCPNGEEVAVSAVCTPAPTAPQATDSQPTTTTPPSSETMPTASSQNVLDAEAQPDDDDAIVVTGSRIVRPDLEAPSPVTTVD